MKNTHRFIKGYILLLTLFFSANGQWEPQHNNLPPWTGAITMDASNENTVVIVVTGGVFLSKDGGLSWSNIFPFTSQDYAKFVWCISIIDSTHLWLGTSGGYIYNTTNAGSEWRKQFVDSSKTTFINYIKMFNKNDGVAMGDALTGTLPALILKTTDGGTHWISVNDSAFGGYSGDTWRRVDFVSLNIGYLWPFGLGIPSSLWKTTDGGRTWLDLNLTGNMQVIRFYDENLGIACFYIYPGLIQKFRRTIDGGFTWENFTPSFLIKWGNDFYFCKDNPARVWFTDGQKLFFSSDTGRTWVEQYTIQGRDIVFASKQVGWVLGDDMLLKTTLEGITSINPRLNGKIVPSYFSLSQNYPNPFNPSTTIMYTLPKESHVVLKVYTIIGKEVATLVNGTQDAGEKIVHFKALNLPSGMYLYTMNANNFSTTKKMVMLK